MISLIVISGTYAANNRYWQCSRCKKMHIGEELPIPPKKCKKTNYQLFHEWKEIPLA